MSTHTIPIRLALGSLALAACFGSGPVPTRATDATVVFEVAPHDGAPGQSCDGTWQYIGGAAFTPLGAGGGYAVELPWQGPDCDQNMGAGLPLQTVQVLAFDGAGDDVLGSAAGAVGSVSGGVHPRVAVDGESGALAWAFDTADTTSGGQGNAGDIDVSFFAGSAMLGPIGLGLPNGMTSQEDTAGLVVGAASAWVGVTTRSPSQIRVDPDLPTFPCCGAATASGASGSLWRIDYAVNPLVATELTSAVSWLPQMEAPLAQNHSTVFAVVLAPSPAVAELDALPKTAGSDADRVVLATLDRSMSPNAVPVGLAATDAHVAWAASIDGSVDPDTRGCWIWVVDLAQPLGSAQPQLLFSSSTLSCSSLTMDATSIYFAIVHDDGRDQAEVGDGIGRIALADGTFESIAVGMAGAYAGPRRVHGFGGSDDTLYAIDPAVIGKLAKSALAGQHDF